MKCGFSSLFFFCPSETNLFVEIEESLMALTFLVENKSVDYLASRVAVSGFTDGCWDRKIHGRVAISMWKEFSLGSSL